MKPVLAFRHVAREPLGTIDGALRRGGLQFHYVDLFERPPGRFDPTEIAGLVVLGGPMNVDETERFPFLRNEIDWIRSTIDRRIPVLGICLGSQLMAAALGARVWHSPIKEIGWYEVELTEAGEQDRLLKHLDKRQTVFQWHGDTFDLPAGAVRLATSQICQNQAFRHGERAWALQFHLEVTADIINCWLDDPAGCAELDKLDYIEPARIREQSPRKLPALERLAGEVFDEFAACCRACAE
jgi:GMP synthase (glutamine-hydrolysing)